MSVVIALALAVIVAGVVVVAMGRGGELDRERPEMPARSDFRTWSDVAGYRPPAALLGFDPRATEHALSLIARTIAERDAEIDWLRERLAEAVRARPEPAPDADERDDLADLSPGSGLDAGSGLDVGSGLETGYREAPGAGAPGFQAAPPGDSDEDGNGHARPSLSRSVSLSGELGPVSQHGVPQISGWQARGATDPAAEAAVVRVQPGERE